MLTKVTDTFFIDLDDIIGILIIEGVGHLRFKNQQDTLKINKDKALKLCAILDDYVAADLMQMPLAQYKDYKRQRDAAE